MSSRATTLALRLQTDTSVHKALIFQALAHKAPGLDLEGALWMFLL